MKRFINFVFISFVAVTIFAQKKHFTVEQIFGRSMFTAKEFAGLIWMEGGTKFSYRETDRQTKKTNIWTYDLTTGKREILIEGKSLKLTPDDTLFKFSSYQWLPDFKKILFVGDPPERQYYSRVKPAGNYFLYDIELKTLKQLTNYDVPLYNQKFSPYGKLFGFVRSNNIYLLNLVTNEEVKLTNDGSEDIINGKLDWVYEEEFGISDGWQWSPDGKYIAFYRLDQSKIPIFNLFDLNSMRIDAKPMRYPKAGDPNSKVKIGIYNIERKQIVWVDIGPEEDIYVPRIKWTNEPRRLSVQRLNRLQETLELLYADAETGKTSSVLIDKDSTWIEVTNDLNFLKNSSQFLWTSEQSGYRHIYLVSNDGKNVKQVTTGNWDVVNIAGVDEKNKKIFFIASIVTPAEKHLFSISFDGKNRKQLTPSGANYSVNISPAVQYFIGNYNCLEFPTKIALFTTDGKKVRMMEENAFEELKDYQLGKWEFFNFKTSDGVELNGRMLKPVDFDSTKQYPALFDVYGGPGSQTVVNSWGGAGQLWDYLLAQKGIIVVSMDNRGTGGRGKAYKSLMYRQLGKWEVNDLVEAAKYLGTLPYINKERVGIWGWSYGGYTTIITMLNGADYFKMGIAVAPVIDWKFYDTIYSERYMARPQDNPDGYKEASAITHARKLKGKLLLVHGTTDDNVHWQNSIQFIDALQKENKQFQTMFYVNRNHGIYGGNTRLHLYTMMTEFIEKNLF